MPTTNGTINYDVEGFDRNNGVMSFETTPYPLDGANVITETTWEPGKVGTKLITVENKGSLNATISLRIKLNNGGLAPAMWYDFVQIGENNSATGDFDRKTMNDPNIGLEVAASQYTATLEPSAKVSFILVYGMYEDAGNEYQGKSLEAFVTVLAKQAPVESDSFDNQYDKDATYDPTVWDGQVGTAPSVVNGVIEIHTPGELAATLAIIPTGTTEIKLMNDINLAGYPWGPYSINDDVTINGDGHAIKGLNPVVDHFNGGTINAGFISRIDTANVTIKNLTIDGAVVTNSNSATISTAAAFVGQIFGDNHVLTFENCYVVNSVITGQFAAGFLGYYESGGGNSGKVVINNCTVTDSSFTGNDATGALIALNNKPATITVATVTDNTINGGAGYSAAALVGTSIGGTTATNVTVSGNTFGIVGNNYQVNNTTYGYIYKNNNTYSVDGSEVNS